MQTPEDFARLGRNKKVLAIVPVLVKSGVTAKDVAGAMQNERFWGLLHEECALKGTSTETRKLVLQAMRDYESTEWSENDIRCAHAAANERFEKWERQKERD